ncbi:MAG: hypothetical protein MESAZ_02793 [Saezia sanguinis]
MLSVDAVLQDLSQGKSVSSWKRTLLKKLLHESRFTEFAEKYPHLRGIDSVEQILDEVGPRAEVVDGGLENIPSEGPVVLVANHPLGGLDGLVLLKILSKVRPDIKVVSNQLLQYLEPLRSLFLGVDNIGNRTSRKQVEQVQAHLQNKGALIFFPAAEVSRLKLKGIRDGQWGTGFIRFAAKARAPIVPIHIAARNSAFFYFASCIYKPLSTALLVREMFNKKNKSLKIRIGRKIPYDNWHSGRIHLAELAGRFRNHTYRVGANKPDGFLTEAPIALPEDRIVLKKAIEACAPLGQTPDGKVIYLYQRCGAVNVPVLRELGRLREVAFRAVGEGSGNRRDLDRYDDMYHHLILWDPQALEVVGAYRFMPAASAFEQGRMADLYSYTLFEYGKEMNDILACGIELGRSFVQPAYWGKRGLDYLWQGIGAYVARYPQYRYLFGPVSISGALPAAARDLLVAFYRMYFSAAGQIAYSRWAYPASVPEVQAIFDGNDYAKDLISLKTMLNNMGCSIPTLYKQYSELCEPGGVQFLDFGIDPDFNHCIDGLVVVDMSRLKASKYQRYIEPYLAFQG